MVTQSQRYYISPLLKSRNTQTVMEQTFCSEYGYVYIGPAYGRMKTRAGAIELSKTTIKS